MPLPLVDDDFPGGAIRVLRAPRRGTVELALRGDTAADVAQWFDFRVSSATSRPLRLVDVARATFDGAWHRYRAMCSTNGRDWSRAPSELDGDDLVILHRGGPVPVEYAYFAPYGATELSRLLGRVERAERGEVASLGSTVQGRPLPVCAFGPEDADVVAWVVARQHPGESPASFAADGLIARLSEGRGRAVARLLSAARVYVVPLVNGDGVHLGNHRTNAAGVDLNRSWDDPDEDDAPEVAALLSAIERTGVDVFLDVHADESAPFAFPSGCEGNPGWGDEQAVREAALRADLVALSPDFVDTPWYGADEPGAADLSAAANAIGERFGATSLTLELPMGDDGDGVIPGGWSTDRARALGAALADVLARAVARVG